MPATVGLRKAWLGRREEAMNPLPVNVYSMPGFSISSGKGDPNQYALMAAYSATTNVAIYLYDPVQDSWALQPTPTFPAGVYAVGNGTALGWHPAGPNVAVTDASAGSFTCAYNNIVHNLVGYRVRIISGAGAGQERTIVSHATPASGSAQVFGVNSAWTTLPDTSSVIQIRSGGWYMVQGQGGSWGVGAFQFFDLATRTWNSSLSITGLQVWGESGRFAIPYGTQFSTGKVVSGSASGIAVSENNGNAKTWAINRWVNYAVRITYGPGAGQTRTITANGASDLTVDVAWDTQPTSSSTFVIEANEDKVYLGGGNSPRIYVYTRSTDSWATISGVDRGGTMLIGGTLDYIDAEREDDWIDESNGYNGRYLYSLRGNGAVTLDRLDITTGTWQNDIAVYTYRDYAYAGTCAEYRNGYLYIAQGSYGRIIRMSPSQGIVTPWSQSVQMQQSSVGYDSATLFSALTTVDGVPFYRFYLAPIPSPKQGVTNYSSLVSFLEAVDA